MHIPIVQPMRPACRGARAQTPQISAYSSFALEVYLGQTHHETSKSISVTLGTVSDFLCLVNVAVVEAAAAALPGWQHLRQRQGVGGATWTVGWCCCSAPHPSSWPKGWQVAGASSRATQQAVRLTEWEPTAGCCQTQENSFL